MQTINSEWVYRNRGVVVVAIAIASGLVGYVTKSYLDTLYIYAPYVYAVSSLYFFITTYTLWRKDREMERLLHVIRINELACEKQLTSSETESLFYIIELDRTNDFIRLKVELDKATEKLQLACLAWKQRNN